MVLASQKFRFSEGSGLFEKTTKTGHHFVFYNLKTDSQKCLVIKFVLYLSVWISSP